jgi:hypothetical protein
MGERMRKPGRAAFVIVVVFTAVSAVLRSAQAGDNTIRQPGDHPNYAVEIEPHLDFAWFNYAGYGIGSNGGVGLGARFTIPIVKNGFVSTINNTVGIGFGGDWVYFGCTANVPSCGVSTLYFPVVMQWNFYVAHAWSVFGEPGFSFNYAFYNDSLCKNAGLGGACVIGNAFFPGPVFEVGGRYHINEHLALTARIGYPDFTFGVSFM